MFQQHGYKFNEYYHWVIRNFYNRVIVAEHFLIIIVIFSLLFLLSERLTITAATWILSLFTLFWFGSGSRYTSEKNKKPLVYTARMKRLAGTLAVIFLFFVFIVVDLSFTGRLLNTPVVIRDAGSALMIAEPYFLLFGLIVADMSVPFFLILAGFLMKPVENRIHNRFKKKARTKLLGFPDLKVIAITGSYGKTSTKYMTHSLLQERYQVCMTPGSYNTPMGICKVINNDLEARHQILLLEMGARYEGNISELCSIAKPDIAVITNVGKAHLETFGSPEAIASEKSTLAKELKPGGTLVLNGDDEIVVEMAALNPEAEIILAGIENGSVRASDIRYDKTGTHFIMKWYRNNEVQDEQPISMRLLGVHNVQNFLLAAAVAHKFGIRPATIALAASRIEPVEHRLELKSRDGLTIIDDAFNSNPVGAKNAIDILTSFTSGRRIIITPGMIELGELQESENQEFGRYIAKADLDLVILVGREQTEPIQNGIHEIRPGAENVHVVSSLFEANDIIREYAREGDVILYENDLPDSFNE
jgi:UDP-N-acetylmuramoyl-tripeptide--D-alanyl-D-alanine ligase